MRRAPALFLAFLAGACDAAAVPSALTGVQAPARLRSGSPLVVSGSGLGGAQLEVRSAAGNARIAIESSDVDGDDPEKAQVALPDVAWPEGSAVREICLIGKGFSGWNTCRSLQARFTRAVTAGPALLGQDHGQHGGAITVVAHDLLLPGEGQVELQVTTDLPNTASVTSVAVATALATGRESGQVQIAPDWLGLAPGPYALRLRLVQHTAIAQATGPWSPPLTFQLEAPTLTPTPDPGLRRGARVPLAIAGVPAGWQLLASGVLRGQDGQIAQTFPVDAPLSLPAASLGAQPTAWLPSPWFLGTLAPLLAQTGPGATFEGQVRVALAQGAQTWLGPPLPVQWPLLPTVQVVVLELGDGLEAGAARFGLAAFSDLLRLRVLALVAAHFANYAVQVTLQAPAAQIEALHLAILDRDPNDLGLLGADSSAGKDDGNLVLDEHLGGYDAASAALGSVAYGGVFLGGFFGFSPTLHPGSLATDSAFDALFAPYAAELGGHAAHASLPPAAALEALAHLIAHTATHEIGHALGLAAGTTDFHHAGDHPGWIMDAGTARPFAERAALPGATPQTWGPVDDAYLRSVLPAVP